MNLFRILSLLFLSSLPGLLSPFWRTDCHSLTSSKFHFSILSILSVSFLSLCQRPPSPQRIHHRVRPTILSHLSTQAFYSEAPMPSPVRSFLLSTSHKPISVVISSSGGTCHEPLTVPHQETKLPKPLVLIFSTVKNFIKRPDVFKRRAAIPHSNPRALHKLDLVSLISCQLHIWARTCAGQAVTALGLLKQAGSGSGCTFPFLPRPLLRNASMPPHPPHPSRTLFWHSTAVSLAIFIFGVKV